ncbi:MAG TPA: TetR/AcrR family transcriptional regulator [Chthoniobacterales bacterium]
MKPPCESKCKLLSVASRLIWENSYGAVSVDDICREADVRKGTFYHFFPSKADLTIAAQEADWQNLRPRLDENFSPQTPPLERFEKYCESTLANQRQKLQEFGKVCGCPTITLGSELSTLNESIRLKAVEIMDRYLKYFESAVRDAAVDGLIETGDPRVTAKAIFAYSQGVLLEAKIRNDLTQLETMQDGMFRLLNLKPKAECV